MAELREVSGDVVYRPLAGLALAGFGISCLFSGVVIVSAVIAIFQGAPFFFSNWTLLIAIAGFIISWAGLNDIRNAEGTKAGQKLATWGMWISLVTGAGYFAYSYFTGLALSQQAFAFLLKYEDQSGFLPRLQKASQNPIEANEAFLLTLPAPDRAGVRPDDEETLTRLFDKSAAEGQPGNLSRFRMNDLVIGLAKGDSESSVEPMGVLEWKYEKRSYQVMCQVRVAMPEANAEVVLVVRSSEGEREGESRRWFVDMTNMRYAGDSFKLTPLGTGLKYLRSHAGMYVRNLEQMLRKGDKSLDFERVDATDWTKFEPALRDRLKPQFVSIFSGAAASDTSWNFNLPFEIPVTSWDRDAQGRLELTIPLTMVTANQPGNPPNNTEGLVVVRTKAPVEPREYADPERARFSPDWEVKQVKFLRSRLSKR